jgi:hypothetical protein
MLVQSSLTFRCRRGRENAQTVRISLSGGIGGIEFGFGLYGLGVILDRR